MEIIQNRLQSLNFRFLGLLLAHNLLFVLFKPNSLQIEHARAIGLLFELLFFLNRNLSLLVFVEVELFKFKSVEEGAAFFVLRDEVNRPAELVDDHPTDNEAEADPIRVDLLLLVLHRAEQFEQLVLVLLLDSSP